MQRSDSKELREAENKSQICRVYLLTGNCPYLSTCHYKHENAYKEETKQTEIVIDQSKSKPKPLLKKPIKKQEFQPAEEGTPNLKEFLDKAHENDDNEVFLDNGGDEIEYIGWENTFFHDPSKDCQCCKGHIYNCEGETCLLLSCCFCYEVEENEKIYNETK